MTVGSISATARAAYGPEPLAPFRRRPVFGIAGGVVVLLLVLSSWHGYYRDELYFRLAGEHLAWGYVDQPPLVPALARLQIEVFGDSVTALRVIPALLLGLVVVMAALIARELGGGSGAQVLAAVAVAVSVDPLVNGHSLHTGGVDLVAWMTIAWLVIRILRTGDTRLWLAVGAVGGVGLLGKYLMALIAVALVTGILLAGPRRVLRGWHLPAGLGIALVIAAPTLVWQATHGWPQLTMASSLSGEGGALARITLLPLQLLMTGPFVAPLWIVGLVALLRRRQWRPFRPVGIAYLVIIALLLVSGGQARYATGILTVLLAAGCVVAVNWSTSRRAWMNTGLVANGVVATVIALPVLPVNLYGDNGPLSAFGQYQVEQTNWPELTDQVAAVYRALPPADRDRAIVYAHNYGIAGALDRFGPSRGLPEEYGGNNSVADFGRPPDDKTVVVAVGADRAWFGNTFAQCEERATLRFDLPHLERGKPILVCRDQRESWATLWPKFAWQGVWI